MKRMPTLIKSLALATALIAISGCATGHYGCPAPNGVTCMSSLQIYDATNDADRVEGTKDGKPVKHAPVPSQEPHEYGAPVTRDAVIIERGALAFDTSQPAPSRLPSDGSLARSPIRTPPKVMRVWVAPWEDESGDLHTAGAVYTEIQPRRWSVGEPGNLSGPRLQLIEPLVTTAKGSDTRQRAALTEPMAAPPPASTEHGGND